MNVNGAVGALQCNGLFVWLLVRTAKAAGVVDVPRRRCHYVQELAMKDGCWTRCCIDDSCRGWLQRRKIPHAAGAEKGPGVGVRIATGQWVPPLRYVVAVMTAWWLAGCAGRGTMSGDWVHLNLLPKLHADWKMTHNASRVDAQQLACAVDHAKQCHTVIGSVKSGTGDATNQCVLCCAVAIKSSGSMNGNDDTWLRAALRRWLVETTNVLASISALERRSELLATVRMRLHWQSC